MILRLSRATGIGIARFNEEQDLGVMFSETNSTKCLAEHLDNHTMYVTIFRPLFLSHVRSPMPSRPMTRKPARSATALLLILS